MDYNKILSNKNKEVWNKISSMGCVDIYHDTSNLDGDFTAEDLRIIADAMDELSAVKQVLGV